MTGSIYKTENDSTGVLSLSRYPDAGENPITALLTFKQHEFPQEGEVAMTGEALKKLLVQLKKDDPCLYEYLTETNSHGEDHMYRIEVTKELAESIVYEYLGKTVEFSIREITPTNEGE